ncbi:MAG: iron-sulfur cluster assembly protein, partial [Cyclobacteriaceae bacterium]|nr:iron-sulfur cluster assembly protein [Cyclobacteriaceae bacterium]
MTFTKDDILKALATVEEPDLKKDLVTLEMISNIETTENSTSFTVILTTPACPLKELIRKSCEEAIHTLVDATIKVTVNMTSDVTSTRDDAPILPGVK